MICERQLSALRASVKIRLRSVACAAAGAALLASASACSSLRLTPVSSTQRRPGNVALYFQVRNAAGDPIPGLTADNFRVYEDGQLIAPAESEQTVLDPDVASAHYTLLLVNLSGKVIQGGDAEIIPQAASAFTVRVEGQQRVGVYAFDGSENLYPIVPFSQSAVGPRGSARAGVRQLAGFKPKDPSTNLNGAVVKALDELGAALGRAGAPLRFGTLVVVTQGTDRASRVSTAEMERRVHQSPFDVFAIGLGAETKAGDLASLGKSGVTVAADHDAVLKAFDDVGTKIASRTKSYYLLAYCSPTRAGRHEVRVEAAFKDSEGDKSGSFESRFDATGFAPGCDPSEPPLFETNFEPNAADGAAPRDGRSRAADDERHTIRAAPRTEPRAPSGRSTNTAETLPPPPPPGRSQDFMP